MSDRGTRPNYMDMLVAKAVEKSASQSRGVPRMLVGMWFTKLTLVRMN